MRCSAAPIISPGGDGAPAGTYRTVCVRTCDGYYFPISYSTVPNRFADDQRACQRQCPAAEAVLYSYRNPGEDINQAVSLNGQPYTELPNAFRYRKEFIARLFLPAAGSELGRCAEERRRLPATLESGDIVVTDQNAKALSQAPQPQGQAARPKRRAAGPTATPTAAAAQRRMRRHRGCRSHGASSPGGRADRRTTVQSRPALTAIQ